ncbi:MAG: hypothetical protein AB9869_18000 [Verrucomicrobiia bacterium]
MDDTTRPDFERRAIEKLRKHPALKLVWREWQGHHTEEGEVDAGYQLTQAEKAAVVGLAKTPLERSVVRNLLRIVADQSPG